MARAARRRIAQGILPPIVQLRPSPELLREITMLWRFLRPFSAQWFLKEELPAWETENERLLRLVRDGDDDDALLALVARDPRYLGTQLLAAKVFWWKLQVIHGAKHGHRGTRHQQAGVAARAKLEKLGRAVTTVTGRGNASFSNHLAVLRQFEDALERVDEALRMAEARKSDKAIAASTGLTAAIVDAIRMQPRQRKQHAEQIVVDYYQRSFSVEHLRRLLRKARLDVDPTE